MTKRQIVNRLRQYRYDPAHRWGKQGCSLANIATLANTHKDHVRKLRDYEHSPGPGWLARVERALEMIERGEVRFVFQGGGDAARRGLNRGVPNWRIEWVRVPRRRPPPQDKMTPAAAHARWARCRTCQGDRWSMVVLHGAPYYFCDACVGPVHWKGLGARAATKEERARDFAPEQYLVDA